MRIINKSRVISKKSILIICLLMFLVFNADGSQPNISSASINQSASALWSLTAPSQTNYNSTVFWSVTTKQDRIYAVESEYYNIPGEANIPYVPYGHSVGTLYAFAGNGVKLWSFTAAIGRPTVVDNTIYLAARASTFSGGLNKLYSLDADNGTQKWSSITFPGDLEWCQYADNMVYVGVAHIVTGEGYFIYALNASSGQQVWRQTFPWGDPYPEQVIINNGILYFGHPSVSGSSGQGDYYALNATNGSTVWQVHLNEGTSGSGVLLSGLLCFSTANTVNGLNATNGEIVWSTPREQGYFFSTLFGYSGSIFYAIGYQEYAQPSDAYKGYPKVYALNALTGNILWSYITKGHDVDPINSELYGSLDIVGQTLYLMMDYTSLYALNTANGQELWSRSGRPFVVDSGIVYFFADNYDKDKNLEAVDALSGRSLWNCSTSAHFITAANRVEYFYVGSTLYALNINANSLFMSSNSTNSPTSNPSPTNPAQTSSASPTPITPELPGWVILPIAAMVILISIAVSKRCNMASHGS
jgi:outer membrane protein assembly factor BamB